jgi:hypothetical protein
MSENKDLKHDKLAEKKTDDVKELPESKSSPALLTPAPASVVSTNVFEVLQRPVQSEASRTALRQQPRTPAQVVASYYGGGWA